MLSRYSMVRGVPSSELPKGIRQDTRKHTSHVLRPTTELVDAFLGHTDEATFRVFEARYRALLEARFAEDRKPFDELVELARTNDVYLGCSCPTKKNPDVRHCHTVVSLHFLAERYPALEVRFPAASRPKSRA